MVRMFLNKSLQVIKGLKEKNIVFNKVHLLR